MSSPKGYTGQFVVEHVVAKGETLSHIAAIYLLADWRPLLIYNTKICRTIRGSNPNKIVEGQRLLIPRSRRGYDRWAATVGGLVAELEGMEIAQNAELDALENEQAADDVLWNLGGEVLTMIASLGVKAVQAGRAAMSAKAAAEGGSVANAVRNSWASVEGYVEEVDGVTEMLSAGWRGAIKKLDSETRKKLGEKIFDEGAKQLLGKEFGKQVVLARKLLKVSSGIKTGKKALTGVAKYKELAGALADGGQAVMEFADMFKVTTVRNLIIVKVAGQTLDAVGSQRKAIASSVARQVAEFKQKSTAIKEEKLLVWGA